jgi:hypothetical protein
MRVIAASYRLKRAAAAAIRTGACPGMTRDVRMIAVPTTDRLSPP